MPASRLEQLDFKRDRTLTETVEVLRLRLEKFRPTMTRPLPVAHDRPDNFIGLLLRDITPNDLIAILAAAEERLVGGSQPV